MLPELVLASCLYLAGIATSSLSDGKPQPNAVGLSGLRRAHLQRASETIGKQVKSAQGEELGEVIELIMDGDGKIAYAVLTIERSLGGNRLYPVPWSAFRPGVDASSLVLQASLDRLCRAPSFHKNNWPDMTDQSWGVALDRYYGSAVQATPHAEPAVADKAAGTEAPASRPGQRSVSGILIGIERLSASEAGSQCSRLKLKNENDGIVIVQVGPFPLRFGEGLRFELDEFLEVTGVMARTSAGPLLLAREVRAGKNAETPQDAATRGPRE